MWEPQIESTGNEEFVAAYQAKFDREPDYHSAAGYAACQVLEAAVTEVGGLDLDPIRDAIRALQMPTVLPVNFRSTRTASRSVTSPSPCSGRTGKS